MNLDVGNHFSALTTDIHQVQKSIFVLESANTFFRENRYHQLLHDDFFMTNLDANRIAAIIGLGKIFDINHRAHSLCYLIKWLRKHQEDFSKEAIIARKIKSGMTEDEALVYAQNFTGIDTQKVQKLADIQTRLQALYDEKARRLRNQAFAHRDRDAQPPGLEYDVISALANGALGVFDDIFHAYYNARDFSLDPREYPWLNDLKRDIESYLAPHRDRRIQVWPNTTT